MEATAHDDALALLEIVLHDLFGEAKNADKNTKVEPMKDVALLVRRHFDGIVAWSRTRQTNGFIEALNGLFQAAKRKARG
jgi:transposase